MGLRAIVTILAAFGVASSGTAADHLAVPVGPQVPSSLAGSATASTRPQAYAHLIVEPSEATLVGPRARQGLLVAGIDQHGRRRDVTDVAHFVSLEPRVARVTS